MAQRSEEIDDDVPPLEDMSEYLEKAKELKSKLDNQETVVAETLAPKQSCATKQNGTAPSELNSSVKGVAAKKDAAAETFGGLKKGFLFGSVEKQGGRKPAQKTEGKKLTPTAGVASSKRTDKGTTGSSSSDDIPFIKPQDGAKSKGLEFPEVQEAMKESYPLLRSQDWVTDDLLTKIGEHPLLSQAFQDPRLAQVISQFQSNPQAVMAATRDNPELRTFLQEFCALMGEHFTTLADKEDNKDSSRHTPLISEASTPAAAEEVRMRELLQRPAVQEALADPRIQDLIATLRSDPDKGQQMLRSSSSQEFQHKIKVLIDNGLLAVQRL